MPRPPIDSLAPIAAGVAVDRRVQVKSSRSTLATLADLEAYLAALFAKEALPVCPSCERLAEWITADVATDRLLQTASTRAVFTFAYPLRPEADTPIEAFLEAREKLAQSGFRRIYLGGKAVDLDEVRPSDFGDSIRIVADRVQLTTSNRSRVVAAFESAWEHGGGVATVDLGDSEVVVRRGLSCPGCGLAFDPPRPGLFSYNSPLGACPACKGFGRTIDVDWAKVLPDGSKTLAKGAIRPWSGKSSEWERGALTTFAKKAKIPLDVPWEQLTAEQRRLVIEGDGAASGEMVWEGRYPGVRAWFKWLETKTYKMHVRVLLARYREYVPCTTCGGGRLNDKARRYRVGDLDLPGWHQLDVQQAHARVLALTPHDPQGARVVAELSQRLSMLDRVGLGYLTLDRQARTLSGGEVQRASLTTALASQLTQALFVLDEPTVGLHPEDVAKLSGIVRELADAGNTVVVIEHDSRIVERADRVVEMGPGAGAAGGAIVAIGPPTRRRPRKAKARPAREPATAHVHLRDVRLHNLHLDEIAVPLGQLVAIVGASGSGKSTFAARVLYPLLARHTGDTSVLAAPAAAGTLVHDAGLAQIKEVVLVDQAPLGRTARGNAATYTKAWNRIRERFAAEPMAQREGLQPSHFSFNVAGKDSGRCEACDGEGFETVEMQFLADVHFPCPVCLGKRFRPEILRVRHQGKNVADILEMTVSEVLTHFHSKDEPDYVLQRALTPLLELGLSYLPLGQPLSTLSGGEAQRLKLARGLAGAKPGMLFLLDEPSAGLAPSDTAGVVDALFKLTRLGASVLVVEHDLDVIAAADHVIELGPDAGPRGGLLVFEGPPSELAGQDTKTGRALADERAGGAKSKRAAKPKHGAARGIEVTGASEHNLKHVSCTIPDGAITVVTGPSGSGKSSLAFDVIYAEGQRRFMETLTPYARQFLPTLPRPNVERVANVPPSIALEQRESRGGSASTVATITEVSHFLRLLFAKLGEPVCLECGGRVRSASRSDVDAALRARGSETITLYARAVARRKGTYASVFSAASRQGITGARVDGEICAVEPPPPLKRSLEHTIDLIVYFGPADALDPKLVARALEQGKGAIRVGKGQPARSDRDEAVMSLVRACEDCGAGVPELEPGHFSFSTQEGRCPACEGKGVTATGRPCKACGGERLGPRGRTTTLFGDTLPAFMRRDVASALACAEGWSFTGSHAEVGTAPQKELTRRLAFAARVGLEYLALERHASTLSGGELQRLALAAQLGSGLTGALYVLDEPTIGLHPRDTDRLLGSLRDLTAMGSTVLVVEHDVSTIRAADFVIDMGPEGGRGGGHVVASGPAATVLAGERLRDLRDQSGIGRDVEREAARLHRRAAFAPIVGRHGDEGRPSRALHRDMRRARERPRNVLRARRLDAPFHVRLREARRLRRAEERQVGEQAARLLPRQHHDRRLVLISRKHVAERMAYARRRMQADERGQAGGPREAVGHADDARLLQAEHVGEIRRPMAEERQLRRAWIAEHDPDAEPPQQVERRLAHAGALRIRRFAHPAVLPCV